MAPKLFFKRLLCWVCHGGHSYANTALMTEEKVRSKESLVLFPRPTLALVDLSVSRQTLSCERCDATRHIKKRSWGIRRFPLSRDVGVRLYKDNIPLDSLVCRKHDQPFIRLDSFHPYHQERSVCPMCIEEQ